MKMVLFSIFPAHVATSKALFVTDILFHFEERVLKCVLVAA